MCLQRAHASAQPALAHQGDEGRSRRAQERGGFISSYADAEDAADRRPRDAEQRIRTILRLARVLICRDRAGVLEEPDGGIAHHAAAIACRVAGIAQIEQLRHEAAALRYREQTVHWSRAASLMVVEMGLTAQN